MSLKKKVAALLLSLSMGVSVLTTGCSDDVDVAALLREKEAGLVDFLDGEATNLGKDAQGNKKITYRVNGIDSAFSDITDSAETSTFSLVANAEANAKSTKLLYTFQGTADNFDEMQAIDASAESFATTADAQVLATYLDQVFNFVKTNMSNCQVSTYKDNYVKQDIQTKKNDVIVAKVLNEFINSESGIDRAKVQEILDKTKDVSAFTNKFCDLGPTVDETTAEKSYNVKLFAEFGVNTFSADLNIKTEAELTTEQVKEIVSKYLNGEAIAEDVVITIVPGTATWISNNHSSAWANIKQITTSVAVDNSPAM